MAGMQRIGGTGVWAGQLRYGDEGERAESAAQLDELGYSALWIPDVGGDVFGAVELLMRSTERAVVATGILNLWMHSPEERPASTPG
jgi:alkanesulfonate monooxygenase SsuD/methylene tetrahydromethanopterin reductase-like flavin-dependent oxidoreductase (luciferase family)